MSDRVKVDISNIQQLQLEFENIRYEMNPYHDRMQFMYEAYKSNVFYKQKPNSPTRERLGINLLQAFADKNWFYLSTFPKISVPAMPEMREQSSLVEKILYSSADYNDLENIWSQITFDFTVMSAGIMVTDVDYKKRRVTHERVDPRRAYWTTSDAQGTEPEVFWKAVPMRRSAIYRKYGVWIKDNPQAESLDYWKSYDRIADTRITEDPYYMVITRITRDSMVRWCGSEFLMEPHDHKLGEMLVDIALHNQAGETDYRGTFYFDKLVELQCEFNDLWRQRTNIVRRLGNPAVWGRNINNNQLQDVKDGLQLDGGFIGLKEGGELGVLTIPETAMVDTHLSDLYQRMQDLAGFPPAAFGQVAGANTSADALGMYYQPTTRQIDHQNKVLRRMLQSANKKCLLMYKNMLGSDERIPLEGSFRGRSYAQGGMMVGPSQPEDFGKDDIVTTRNIVTPGTVTPKDDISYKRLMYEMARDGTISKTTALDEMGFISPQDEIDMLEAETSNESLNPEGNAKLLQAQAQMQQADVAMMNGAAQQPPAQPAEF